MTDYIAREMNEEKTEFDLTTSESTSERIPYAEKIVGGIGIDSGSSITSLTFWVAIIKDGTLYALHDSNNAAVTRTVTAAKAYQFPDECCGFAEVVIVVDSADTIEICRKS